MGPKHSLFEVLRRFAATVVDPAVEVSDVLYELGDNVCAVLNAAGAGVSVATNDRELKFVTATSADVVALEQVQERHQAGPCVEAFTTGAQVTITNISQLENWPDYRQAAHQAGFAAVIGLPLAVGDRRVGSLNVYETRVRDWSSDDLDTAQVLADIATAYIVHAGQLAEARHLSEQLQHALDARIVIEQAKGMLARDHHLPVDQAFELLRSHCRSHNLPLRSIAHAIVELDLLLPDPRVSGRTS